MRDHAEAVYTLIGRYIVLSAMLAAGLIVHGDIPFWCAFPAATIWMALRGHIRPVREDRDDASRH